MNRKIPIMVAVVLLLGYGIIPALPALSVRSAVAAAEHTATGLVRSVDADADMLVLDTASGVQRVHVAHNAAIHDEHDDVLTLRQIRPGDAVAYEMTSSGAIDLHVTRQFYAVPSEG
jgi:hypothetical protein